jgi:hypothetical protein
MIIQTGWKVRKYPAAGDVFFLTFPFIELFGAMVQRMAALTIRAG